MAARGLTDIILYAWLLRAQESADISVKLWARSCYNIYVIFSIVLYSIACNYPSITTLQVRYYVVRRYPYHPHGSEQAEEKTIWLKMQAIMLLGLQALAHIERLEFASIHICWLFIASFKHLAHLFSFNVAKQCWKVWCRMKCNFSSLCQTKFCMTGNE